MDTKASQWWKLERTPIEIWEKYYKRPSIRIRDRLVTQNYGLVLKVVSRFEKKCTCPKEDLEAAGLDGLRKAIDLYEPQSGNAFSSIAVPWIRGEILHYLRDNRSVVTVPRAWKEFYGAVDRLRREFEVMGRDATMEECAIALKSKLSGEWAQIAQATRNLPYTSLDEMVTEVRSPEQEQHQGSAYKHLMLLPQRQREAVRLHILEEVEIKNLPAMIGGTVQEISGLIQEGLAKMRSQMEGSHA